MSKIENRPLAIIQKMQQNDHFSKWLDLQVLSIAEGYCKLKMVVRKEMLNGLGLLHGGVSFSLADTALAYAANSYGRAAVTLDANIAFAKSAKVGDILLAEAYNLHIGHKTGSFDINITREGSEEVFYFFRGTVYRSSKWVL